MLTEELLTFFERQGSKWVGNVRQQQRSRGRTLTPVERAAFAPFFHPSLLDNVRVSRVPSLPNPDFYAFLLEQSIAIPLDFTRMAAITFVDTILLSARHAVTGQEIPLLFHELVHVVQYSALGLDEFLRRYVRGWASNGFQYSRIPLERWAYELEARFRSGGPPFGVAAEVKRQLGEAS